MAIAGNEGKRDQCAQALTAASSIAISAGTLYEALVVARRNNIGDELAELLATLDLTVHPIDEAAARRVAATYDLWGKGVHVANLNLADCFAYTLAHDLSCPLLYIGNDFAKTDIASAI